LVTFTSSLLKYSEIATVIYGFPGVFGIWRWSKSNTSTGC
jgi:hypothetical protein